MLLNINWWLKIYNILHLEHTETLLTACSKILKLWWTVLKVTMLLSLHGMSKNALNNSNFMMTVWGALPRKEAGSRPSWEQNAFKKAVSTTLRFSSTKANCLKSASPGLTIKYYMRLLATRQSDGQYTTDRPDTIVTQPDQYTGQNWSQGTLLGWLWTWKWELWDFMWMEIIGE